MTEERDRAIQLANKVLDRPNGDPDDDLATLARQFLRAIEATDLVALVAELRQADKQYSIPVCAKAANAIERLRMELERKRSEGRDTGIDFYQNKLSDYCEKCHGPCRRRPRHGERGY